MASKWNIIKNFSKKNEPAPEAIPLIQTNTKGGKIQPQDIEMSQPTPAPSVFAKFKETVSQALVLQKAKQMTEAAQEKAMMSMRFSRNLPFIIVLCCAGCFFMVLAFAFLPVIVLVPHKFSLSFCIGGCCFLSAISLVKEPTKFFKSLFKGEMLKWSVLYGASMLGTIAASLVFQSRIISLVLAIAQVVSLSWIIAISVPGGKMLIKAIQATIKKFCSFLGRLLFRTS